MPEKETEPQGPRGEVFIRVRYAETDQMGALHHANYLVYFELGRIELLRSRGFSYRELEQQGFLLVVARAEVKYHLPARYDDNLRLETTVDRVTPARIEHRYQLFRDSALIAEGRTTLACVDRSGQLQRMPEVLL